MIAVVGVKRARPALSQGGAGALILSNLTNPSRGGVPASVIASHWLFHTWGAVTPSQSIATSPRCDSAGEATPSEFLGGYTVGEPHSLASSTTGDLT